MIHFKTGIKTSEIKASITTLAPKRVAHSSDQEVTDKQAWSLLATRAFILRAHQLRRQTYCVRRETDSAREAEYVPDISDDPALQMEGIISVPRWSMSTTRNEGGLVGEIKFICIPLRRSHINTVHFLFCYKVISIQILTGVGYLKIRIFRRF
jgi:hypothetical protein